jgi:ribonuclease HI
MLRRFETFRLTHVRREHNSEADRLANQGIDNASP